MEKEKILDIVENLQDKSNKDLFLTIEEINKEFDKKKEIIIDLTRHLDNLEKIYNEVNNEIGKRVKK